MNKALDVLYNEHLIIKSVIEFRDKISTLASKDPARYRDIIIELIVFFRNYADKFHHYKEEKLLFPLMCEKNEMLKDSIIEEMLDNHRDFRMLVKSMESAVESGNYEETNKLLTKYTEMLLDHIAVEDEELFQMAETLIDENELEKMYYDFKDIDAELGLEIKRDFEKMNKKLDSEISEQ
jgi:hemerythrin-like domain-containing protein